MTVQEALDRLLLVGRQDYVVRSLRVDTQAETWNATFARMELISPGGAAASVRSFLGRGGDSAPEPAAAALGGSTALGPLSGGKLPGTPGAHACNASHWAGH